VCGIFHHFAQHGALFKKTRGGSIRSSGSTSPAPASAYEPLVKRAAARDAMKRARGVLSKDAAAVSMHPGELHAELARQRSGIAQRVNSDLFAAGKKMTDAAPALGADAHATHPTTFAFIHHESSAVDDAVRQVVASGSSLGHHAHSASLLLHESHVAGLGLSEAELHPFVTQLLQARLDAHFPRCFADVQCGGECHVGMDSAMGACMAWADNPANDDGLDSSGDIVSRQLKTTCEERLAEGHGLCSAAVSSCYAPTADGFHLMGAKAPAGYEAPDRYD
jgi:hypothetical protein